MNRLQQFLWRLELFLAFAPLALAFLAGPAPGAHVTYRCVRVVDGDTIIVRLPGGRQTCRLIGVDTPETVHPNKAVERFGKEASAFLKKLVKGRDVRIGSDGPKPTYDKYRRRLVYVYLDGSPPIFVNREIVAHGYGHVFDSQPFAHLEDFRVAEKNARRDGLGLWAPSENR